MNSASQNLAIIAIGRNEGARLTACLHSLLKQVEPSQIVYVDSGSTDGSRDRAYVEWIRVIELASEEPYTAARARNAGFAALADKYEFVQFIDGDCELREGWLAAAAKALTENPTLAIVCGRRREKSPDASPYNRLCDIEWNTPVRLADACGGDALIRVSALKQIGGYDPAFVAGEDPEMCARLRAAGWKIQRLDAEMTLHDAAMKRFSQWWRRMLRAGHAYAQVGAKHPPMWRHERLSNWAWGFILPLTALCMSYWSRGISVAVALLAYLLLWIKIYAKSKDALYARYTTLAKLPLALGQMRYYLNRLRGKRSRLIEYKQKPAEAHA